METVICEHRLKGDRGTGSVVTGEGIGMENLAERRE